MSTDIFPIGASVEWTGTDGRERFGVVMSAARESMDAKIVECSVNTFAGDPSRSVPVEVSRLRPATPVLAERGHPIAILNTSIATAYGSYIYEPIDVLTAQRLASGKILSAVGHESTAQILSELLVRPVPVNRIQYAQEPGTSAIVFKLRGRPPEGQILTREEIDAIGFDFGLMTRTA